MTNDSSHDRDAESVPRADADDPDQRHLPDRLSEEAAEPASGVGTNDSLTAKDGESPARPSGTEDDPVVAELVDEVDAVKTLLLAMRQERFSGMLPHPEHWGQYDEDTRERILRMSEAYTTDESARRDRTTDAEIAEAPKGRRNALWLVSACLVGAMVSILVNPGGMGVAGAAVFIALPVANMVRDFIQGRSGKSAPPELES